MYERLLVVGWDGATWDYLHPLLDKGELPNLAGLMTRGTHAVLRSTLPYWTNVAWASLATGTWPGKTGVYDGLRRQDGRYTPRPSNLATFRGTRLWHWVNKYGKSTGLINVPMTYPASPLDGFLVTGFDSPSDSVKTTYPRGLLESWKESGIFYTVLDKQARLLHDPNLDRYTTGWIEVTHEQGEVAAQLWRDTAVDLLFTDFMATDAINHRTHDMTRIATVYRAADRALGSLLDTVDGSTMVCLISDHGSTPAHWYVSLYRLLTEAGWLHFRSEISPHFWKRLPGKLGLWARRFWQQTPHTVRRAVSWPLLRLDPRPACGYENIDWDRTTVYALTPMGPLYFNKKGREPSGVVSDAEIESLEGEVIRTLRSALAGSGIQPLFARVATGDEAFPEAPLGDDCRPDFLFELADYRCHTITGYPTDPAVRPIPDAEEYGTHTPFGIFVLAGPNVRSGTRITPANIVDVMPTLVSAWGMPVPAEVDGRVLQEAFERPLPEQRMVSEFSIIQDEELTDKEVEEITERLRALGYL